MGRSLHCNHAGFNPRTHTGCDSRHLADHCGCCRFNPRAHTGCDKKVAKTLLSYTCFNPRTHTGCDKYKVMDYKNDIQVSIHTPTRGATLVGYVCQSAEGVSIHAPTRGATSEKMANQQNQWFQSTHPHGVRRCIQQSYPNRPYVSIHAPTRGATSMRLSLHFGGIVSIHAPTRGATCNRFLQMRLCRCFNPRTHTGCDIRFLANSGK